MFHDAYKCDHLFLLTQLSVEGSLAHVQLLLTLSDSTIDLNEEIYTADVTIAESMNFSLQGVTEGRSGPTSDQAAPTLPLSAVKDVSLVCTNARWVTL